MKILPIQKESTDSQDRYLAELQALPSAVRKKLPRQQKLLIQKLKNRRSAQKSRDERKLYISQLQQRIVFLERQNKRLTALVQSCGQCSRALGEDEVEAEGKAEVQQPIQVHWQRVSLNSQAESLSKFILLALVVLTVFAGLGPQAAGSKTAFFSVPKQGRGDGLAKTRHPAIRYTPYKPAEQCLLNHVLAGWQAEQKEWPKVVPNQTGLLQRVRGRQDTVVCEGPKIIRGEVGRGQGFEISQLFELMLDGRQLRQYGLVDSAWQGEMRCEYETYRILAQVKHISTYSNFQCFSQ